MRRRYLARYYVSAARIVARLSDVRGYAIIDARTGALLGTERSLLAAIRRART